MNVSLRFLSLATFLADRSTMAGRSLRASFSQSSAILVFILGFLNPAYSEEFVGDITRFSPSVGQPLFPVGNINVFKQFAFQLEEKLKVGKTVDTVILGSFGAEARGEVSAAMGFEFGLCFGGNADYDLAFKPRISVPDKFPYEFPLTLHVDEGFMADSNFTTNFPPLGKAYADLIFDVDIEAKFQACVFGCLNFTLISFKTANLGGMTYMNIPLGAIVPSEIAGLFAVSLRCDDSVKEKAFTSIELASWNRGEKNKFKMLNVFAKSAAEFLTDPTLEFGGPIESSGGSVFTVDADKDTLTTGGAKFKSGDSVALETSQAGRLPGGLAEKKVYYVVGAAFLGNGDTFKLARRKGGSPLDILNTGDGTHEIGANDSKEPGSPKGGGFDSFGKISITAPTVSTDSSVSEIDDSKRNFGVFESDVIHMEPRVNIASGLEGFPNDAKVRVANDGSNGLPDGLNAACVYYVINATTAGLMGQEFQLATSVGGLPVEITPSILTNKIFRNADFNSADGLSSTGAEDVAAVTIDVVKLVNEVAFKASPLKMQAVYDLGVASVDYKLLSLEVGPAIQLQTDFKMSWDLVVDDILFSKPGTMAEADVRFVEKVNENVPVTDFSSLTKAFPSQVFHMTNRGDHKIPEISLLDGDEVCVTILYHLEPKLKTKVSAPVLGRVKYEALEVGAQIDHVGGIRLGPLVEGEHQFKLGDFTVYDGNPIDLNKGKVEPRTDFEQADDRDRYELVLVDETNGEITPDTGCAEIFIIRTGTSGEPSDLQLKIFDVEGEVIEKRRGSVADLLPETGGRLAELLKDWPTPDEDEKIAIMKSATKQADISPGVMKFELQADGPADYHWKPLTQYKASGETDFAMNKTNEEKIEALPPYNEGIDDTTGGTIGYPENEPKGFMSYGYLKPGNSATATLWEIEYNKDEFVPFPDSSWTSRDAGEGNAVYFLHEGIYMDPSTSVARGLETVSGEAWPVRRWTSPGGRVDLTWGVAMYPGNNALARTPSQDSLPQPSDGVTGALYVNGVLKDAYVTAEPTTHEFGREELSFELDFQRGTTAPWLTLRNTGGVAIKDFSLSLEELIGFPGLETLWYEVEVLSDVSGYGGSLEPAFSNRSFIIRFPPAGGGLPPGREVSYQLSFASRSFSTFDGFYQTPTDYRHGILNNWDVAANVTASVTGLADETARIILPHGPVEPAYRFRSSSIPTSEVAMQKRTVSLDLKKGDVVDLVLSPKGPNRPAGNSNDGWQDVAVTSLNISAAYEWASLPDTPTNWLEFLSGNAPHQPNAYPGSVFTVGTATNWATIDRVDTAPYPSLTTPETIGTLHVKNSARLSVVSRSGNPASLTVHDGAVANSGTVEIFPSIGGAGAMILGGPGVSDISLAGSGTLKLRGFSSSLEAWHDPNPGDTSGSVRFVNYNTIQGSGSAMHLLSTHPASQSFITNVGTMRAEDRELLTSAKRFLNLGELSSRGDGDLIVEAEKFENRFGALVDVSGEGSQIIFSVDESANSGLFRAHDKGALTLAPRSGLSVNLWIAGLNESSEQRGTFLADDATLSLVDTKASGGTFVARNGGEMHTSSPVTGVVGLTGSNVEIGDFDPAVIDSSSGSLNLNAASTRFIGVALRNFGQVIVGGGASADVIDGRLFENHGTIRVHALGSLRFREISERTVDPNASEISTSFPGLANATGETLLGGTWDISGELLIDGAAINKIGADVQPDTPSSVTDGSGNALLRRDPLDSQLCALSLCQPASVILRGPNASFPALDFLSTNCGTLNLLDGASIPRGAPTLPSTDGDFSTYRLSLMSVGAPAELVASDTSLVVVALVGSNLHVRIFDAVGNTIVDKTEAELIAGQDRSWLKGLVSNDPFPEVSTFSQNTVLDIIERARSISGYADFFNRGNIVVSGEGSLKVGGAYHQSGGALDVQGTSVISSATGEYVVLGGSVAVGPDSQFMNLNAARDGFRPGTTIVVASPYGTGTAASEITPAAVNFAGSVITTIDAGVSLTLHGSAVTFPNTIRSNAGEFIISGDFGEGNSGKMTLGTFTGAGTYFTNAGKVKIVGSELKIKSGGYTQNGNASMTHISAGAKLHVFGDLTVSEGELVVDIESRPHHGTRYDRIQASSQANFNDKLVINFGGDFQERLRPDVGDTWEIMTRKTSTRISGFENTTFHVNDAPMPADWLPMGTHLEMVQLPTSFAAPRGLAVRVAPDAGWILYDDWVKANVDGANLVSDYAAFIQDYYFGSNGGAESSEYGGLQSGLVEQDGREFYTLTYARRSGVDATFRTWGSVDMKNWSPAPMAVESIIIHDDGSGLETVSLQSSFDLPDHRLFLQVRGTLNLDNAVEGLVPSKPIRGPGGGLRDFEQYLIQKIFNIPLERRNGSFHPDDIEAAAQQLPYRIVPGRVLYFAEYGDQEKKNSVIGGTAANGVDRDFIYQDMAQLPGAVIHAGLLDHGEYGIVKVTFIERQPTFIGSTQKSPDGRVTVTSSGKTSEAAQKGELYSYRVEAYVDPFTEN